MAIFKQTNDSSLTNASVHFSGAAHSRAVEVINLNSKDHRDLSPIEHSVTAAVQCVSHSALADTPHDYTVIELQPIDEDSNVYIHYHHHFSDSEKPEKAQNASNVKLLAAYIRYVVHHVSSFLFGGKKSKKVGNMQQDQKMVKEGTEKKEVHSSRDQASLIQKVAFFALGSLVGCVVGAVIAGGAEAFLFTATALGALIVIVNRSTAIVKELKGVIDLAKKVIETVRSVWIFLRELWIELNRSEESIGLEQALQSD